MNTDKDLQGKPLNMTQSEISATRRSALSTLSGTPQLNDQQSEDLFRIIEKDDYVSLQQNLEQVGQTRLICQRTDRISSPFIFAALNKATNCFKVLFEHSERYVTQKDTFLSTYFNASDVIEIFMYVAETRNFTLLDYMLNEVESKFQDFNSSSDQQQSLVGEAKDPATGQTALHLAAKQGYDAMIYKLVTQVEGLSVNIKDNRGNTPLHIAVAHKQTQSIHFLLSLKADVDSCNADGETPLHTSVLVANLRSCKDLLIQGASRKLLTTQGLNSIELAKRTVMSPRLKASFVRALKEPKCYGCFIGKLPLMPLKKSIKLPVIFMILFWAIFLSQVFVIEPILDVYYFMISTCLCSLKLIFFFHKTWNSKPGYLEKDSTVEDEDDDENETKKKLEWDNLLQKIDSKHLCPYCKLITTASSVHCHVCGKCTDRFEAHCMWTNNCVGRKNSNKYLFFVFYVWLVTFLLGWTSMSSIHVVHCEIEHCIYAPICVWCNVEWWHYFWTIGDMLVCFWYFVPSSWLCCKQWIIYGMGETTPERFRRLARLDAQDAKDKSTVALEFERTESYFSSSQFILNDKKQNLDEPENQHAQAEAMLMRQERRGNLGCWGNTCAMCCQQKSLTQGQLFKLHTDDQYSVHE